MVTTRKRALAEDIPASPNKRKSKKAEEEEERIRDGSEEGYEKLREERIRENLERMQKLGIINLSHQLNKPRQLQQQQKQLLFPRRGDGGNAIPRSPPLPSRRSSRLQNATPVSYAEINLKGDADPSKKRGILVEEGQNEELYTDEHEKLLGTCETSWILFVDGYGCNGKRIYNQIVGKTCHQCRQKTLGQRTHCNMCNLVQGQFCGDCLYMRYGENVLEVKKNPNWICPVCRGICNCSLCRLKKGWAPTGTLYKKVLSLGFKSVAHYLIQTRRDQTNSGDENTTRTSSSKKSLRFTDSEEDPSKPENPLNSENGLKLVAPCNKNNVECNGKGRLRSEDDHVVSNDLVNDTPKVENKSESTATAKPIPDSIASRLRKRRRNRE